MQVLLLKCNFEVPPYFMRSSSIAAMNQSICRLHIDGLVQVRRNSSALTMELRPSCTNPSMYESFRSELPWCFTESVYDYWNSITPLMIQAWACQYVLKYQVYVILFLSINELIKCMGICWNVLKNVDVVVPWCVELFELTHWGQNETASNLETAF